MRDNSFLAIFVCIALIAGGPDPEGPPPTKLEVTDLVDGTGAEAKAGDEVTVHYVLLLHKNGKEVESSLIAPADLAYGKAGVPPAIGPDEALVSVVDLIKVR